MRKLRVTALLDGRVIDLDAVSGIWTVFIDGVCYHPDEIVDDPRTGRVYWLDRPDDADPGRVAIERVEANGAGRVTIVPGGVGVPSGLIGDFEAGKLYWGVRGSPRVLRCDLDGSHIEDVIDLACTYTSVQAVRRNLSHSCRGRGFSSSPGVSPGRSCGGR
ncbi:hypothetical protein [Nocardia sp. alder85J]|uniref:hypothetical protein n=1 Tax=Nocardia sp. alder85J TaxID=2862949 RepID=UPI001CD507FD|nr:hypothetical protein [Nocardia sp. alder85J]MCX4096623.1 hypothetical protein [Nocardia sp. alder85J]